MPIEWTNQVTTGHVLDGSKISFGINSTQENHLATVAELTTELRRVRDFTKKALYSNLAQVQQLRKENAAHKARADELERKLAELQANNTGMKSNPLLTLLSGIRGENKTASSTENPHTEMGIKSFSARDLRDPSRKTLMRRANSDRSNDLNKNDPFSTLEAEQNSQTLSALLLKLSQRECAIANLEQNARFQRETVERLRDELEVLRDRSALAEGPSSQATEVSEHATMEILHHERDRATANAVKEKDRRISNLESALQGKTAHIHSLTEELAKQKLRKKEKTVSNPSRRSLRSQESFVVLETQHAS